MRPHLGALLEAAVCPVVADALVVAALLRGGSWDAGLECAKDAKVVVARDVAQQKSQVLLAQQVAQPQVPQAMESQPEQPASQQAQPEQAPPPAEALPARASQRSGPREALQP